MLRLDVFVDSELESPKSDEMFQRSNRAASLQHSSKRLSSVMPETEMESSSSLLANECIARRSMNKDISDSLIFRIKSDFSTIVKVVISWKIGTRAELAPNVCFQILWSG